MVRERLGVTNGFASHYTTTGYTGDGTSMWRGHANNRYILTCSPADAVSAFVSGRNGHCRPPLMDEDAVDDLQFEIGRLQFDDAIRYLVCQCRKE